LFLEFLQGKYDLECTPWGNPTYNIFGWQKPCYLLGEGHVSSFRELMEDTAWENYGHTSGNPSCRDCMVHCGYEPSAVSATFGSLRGFMHTARVTLRDWWRREESGSTESVEIPAAAAVSAPHLPSGARRSADFVELPVLR
jgi:hypothetical protein